MTSSYSEKVMKVKTALENIFLKKNIGSSNGDKNIVTDSNGNIVTEDKPSYTPTITSATSSSYVVGTLNLNGTDEIIYGKDVNSNTLGFQIRTNSMEITPTDKTYRYRLLLQTGDNNKYMPVNTSTSTAHNTSKTSTMNTREFLLGGDIRYYSGSTAIAVGSVFSATNMMQQYNITLGYSFNNTSTDLTLSDNIPVYMVVQQSSTNPSMAKLASPFYTQTLPNTEDGLLYVQLGYATAATTMELTLDHPIFHYKDGKVQLFSPNNHTHSQYSTFTGNYNDLTNKPTIPSASSTTPSADTASGSVGSGTTWAKADHTHPKSTLYAEASHSHDDRYYTESEIDTKLNGKVNTSQGTTNSGKFLKVNSSGNVACESVTIPSAYTHPSTHPASMITGLANVATSGLYDDLDNKPDIPSATSDLTNDGNGEEPFLTHSDISAVGISNSYEDLDNKPTIPSASSTTPSADVSGGAVGTGTTWAKADHQHPLSSAYATSGHNHNGVYQPAGNYLTSQDITGKQDKSNIVTNWNTTLSDEKYPSEKLVKTSLNGKVDTDGNKVLSDNNFTNAYKTTIDGLPNNYQAKGDYASSTHNHSGTYVDGVTGNNTTNGSAIAEIKANTTSKGTIYHPKINNANLTGVPTSNQNLSFGGNFKVNQVSANTDGHVTGLTERTLTLPSLPNIPQTLSDLELEDDSTVYLSNGNTLVNFDTVDNSISLLDGMLYYDISNQQIIYNNTDVIATLSDIPSNLTVPTASTTTPSADTTSGSYGSGTSYARSNHSHPKSSLYAEATHAHDYTDLTNKPSYTATVTSDTSGAYEIGKININGSDQTIYGKDTHQSLTPTRVYNCTSFNSTYIDTSSTNNLSLYKLGDLYFLRYFISTKNLVYSTTDYNINSDTIPSDYRPPGDRTFYISTNINVNGRIVIKSNGRVTISASANNQTIYTAGTLTYWW